MAPKFKLVYPPSSDPIEKYTTSSPPPSPPIAPGDSANYAPPSVNAREAAQMLNECHNIVFVTGAGISTSAGIPDFRGSGGVYSTNYGKDLFDDATSRSRPVYWLNGLREMRQKCEDAHPTDFHRMLAQLHTAGMLKRVYSQNVDCLERRQGALAARAVVLLHGSFDTMTCRKNEHIVPADDNSWGDKCPECVKIVANRDQGAIGLRGAASSALVGTLIPRITLNNAQSTYDSESIAERWNHDAQPGVHETDAIVVAGTGLAVNELRKNLKPWMDWMHEKDCPVIWVNRSLPRADVRDKFTLQVNDDCDVFARAMMELI